MPTLLSWKTKGVPSSYVEYVTEICSVLTLHKEIKTPTDAETLRWYGFVSLIDLFYNGDKSFLSEFIPKE